MLATIEKGDNGFSARYERHYNASVGDVWSCLTENEKLSKWFSELSVNDLREGSHYNFDMQDGTFIEMKIIELKMFSILEFMWSGKDTVRFELSDEPEGCKLVLIESIEQMTDHTPKDLAGWHVCLEVINALLDGRTIESREEEWKKWYEKYKKAVKEVSASQQ